MVSFFIARRFFLLSSSLFPILFVSLQLHSGICQLEHLNDLTLKNYELIYELRRRSRIAEKCIQVSFKRGLY